MAGKLPSAQRKLKFAIQLKSSQKIAIVVSEWNPEITNKLLIAAKAVIHDHGLLENLIIVQVPGSFELPFTASLLLKNKKVLGVIALGCVIQGETKHDDYINHTIAQSFSQLSLQYSKPLLYGVLTTNDHKQALDRAGGKYGNKGEECAIALLKMLNIQSLIQDL